MSKSYSKEELQTIAKHLASKGIGGDSKLVHMNPRELRVMEQALGRKPTRNPHTGLPSFDDGGSGGSDGGNSDGSGANADGSVSEGASNNGHGPSGNQGNNADGSESEGASNNGHGPTSGHSLAADDGIAGAIGGLMGKLGLTEMQDDQGNLLGLDVDQGQMAKAAINGLMGMVPGLGQINSISGILGGPTVGDLGKAAINGTLGTGGVAGSAGGSSPGNAGGDKAQSKEAQNKQAPSIIPQIQPVTTADFLKAVDSHLISSNPIFDQLKNSLHLPQLSSLPPTKVAVDTNDLATPLLHLITGVG